MSFQVVKEFEKNKMNEDNIKVRAEILKSINLEEERKLLKLQSKAQECVSREKAQKIIKKSDKWSLKNNIIL